MEPLEQIKRCRERMNYCGSSATEIILKQWALEHLDAHERWEQSPSADDVLIAEKIATRRHLTSELYDHLFGDSTN